MKTALVLIDIQNDYFPGGRMEVEGSVEAGVHAKDLLTAFRKHRLPVIHIQHVSSRPGATFFVPGAHGVEIHDNVAPQKGEPLIRKNFPNSFRGTELLEHLQDAEITRIVIAGMMTHMCVDATTRAAFDYGFQCIVVSDACASRALSFGGTSVPADHVHTAFLAALNGIYADVIGTTELMASLGQMCSKE